MVLVKYFFDKAQCDKIVLALSHIGSETIETRTSPRLSVRYIPSYNTTVALSDSYGARIAGSKVPGKKISIKIRIDNGGAFFKI